MTNNDLPFWPVAVTCSMVASVALLTGQDAMFGAVVTIGVFLYIFQRSL